MKIKQLEIRNLQSFYYDESEKKKNNNIFDFTDGVNIISGLNAGGKSAVFNAFNWILYNRVYVTDVGWKNGVSAKELCDRAKKDNSDIISIWGKLKIIAVNDKTGEDLEWTFIREAKFQKEQAFINMIDDGSELQISFIDEVGQTQYREDIDNVLNTVLPYTIKDYIWFQGESIDDLIDFNNPQTINKAINQISYLPVYEKIHKIISNVDERISKKINKHLELTEKGNKQVQALTSRIDDLEKKIKSNKGKIEDNDKKITEYNLELNKVRAELDGLSAATEYADKLERLDRKESLCVERFNAIVNNEKNHVINSWMLKGVKQKIISAKELISSFSMEIKEKSETDNPIPKEVPGAEYIKQMLEDEMCYVCERSAKKGSEAYKVIADRLQSASDKYKTYNKKKEKYDQLTSNYTSLISLPDSIIYKVEQIDKHIEDLKSERTEIINERKQIQEQKRQILEESGATDPSGLKNTSYKQKQMLEKFNTLNENIRSLERRNQTLNTENKNDKNILESLKNKRKTAGNKKESIPEENAENAIEFIQAISLALKNNAKENLLKQIEVKATELYGEYLKKSESFIGSINIDRESYRIDIYSESGPVGVNKGTATAAKMSVVNAVLYLSSVKFGKSYPMISDAPSSVFDKNNTASYMSKVGKSFEQVIIMTKDLWGLENEIKKEDTVETIYQLNNKKIDPKITEKTRSNFRTYVKKIYP